MVSNGTESLTFLGPRICETVPDHMKKSNSLEKFKLKKKTIESRKLSMQILQKILTTRWFFIAFFFIFYVAYIYCIIFKSHFYFEHFLNRFCLLL